MKFSQYLPIAALLCVAPWWGNAGQTQETPAFIELKGHTDTVSRAVFYPDGKKVVTSSEDKTIRIWDAATGKEVLKLEGTFQMFSPDGKKIAAIIVNGNDTRIFDADSDSIRFGKELQKLGGWMPGWMPAFSPDGKKCVTTTLDLRTRIWDVHTGEELRKLEGHTGFVFSIAFSPDGKKIVTAGQEGTALIWDAESGEELKKLEGHEGWVTSADFIQEGKKVVTVNANGVRIWNAESGMELHKLETPKTVGIVRASFSPDGKRILLADAFDKTIQIWDAELGSKLQMLEGHENIVFSYAFSLDGKRIVTASSDKSIRIWDAQSGAELQRLVGFELSNTAPPAHAFFSPDGKKVVSAGPDNTVRIWDLERFPVLPPPVRPAIRDF
jgi:WD40 repeat protein